MQSPTIEAPSKYQFKRRDPLNHLQEYIESLARISQIVEEDRKVQEYLKGHLEKLKTNLDHHGSRGTTGALECYASFLPPRLVEACEKGTLIPFFGGSICQHSWTSVKVGIPAEMEMLTKRAQNDWKIIMNGWLFRKILRLWCLVLAIPFFLWTRECVFCQATD